MSGRAHALLSASGASMWLACPPSAKLQATVPDKGSAAAAEGTLAHELAELYLRRRLTPCSPKAQRGIDAQAALIKEDPRYDATMENAVMEYRDLVEEYWLAAKKRSADAVLLLEEKVNFSKWVPEGFGSCDTVIIADGKMDVVDFKYGQGVLVEAQGNPQMRLYALGALDAYDYLYGITEIRTTIVQPRKDSITVEELSSSELLAWGNEVVRPAARLAYAGKGDFNPGEKTCQWCRVKGKCRARKDKNMALIEYEFQDPALLSLEELAPLLAVIEEMLSWGKDVKDYCLDAALNGDVIPGYKLVEGRSNRKFTDPESVKATLLKSGFEENSIIKPQELVTLSELEKKVLGKKRFVELLADYVVKPPGKPVLVPETDPRAELRSVEKDFETEEFLDGEQ